VLMASTLGGTSMPTARAVCKLMTNSNFVDCTTGSSSVDAALPIGGGEIGSITHDSASLGNSRVGNVDAIRYRAADNPQPSS
jgi:hypothetical protein